MAYDHLLNAVSLGNAKEAALYFDRVVPLDLLAGMTDKELEHSIGMNNIQDRILKSLLPEVKDVESFYRGHIGIAQAFWGVVALQKTRETEGSCAAFFDQDSRYVNEIRNCIKLSHDDDIEIIAASIDNGGFDFEFFRESTNRMIENGINSIGIDCFSTWRDFHYQRNKKYPGRQHFEDEECVTVALQGLDLIDSDSMSWSDILEIRNDPESLRELRDLRRFLHKEYEGKNPEFVRDSILSCVEMYNDRVKNLGLKTKMGYLSMVATKEGAAFASIGTALAFLSTGMPVDPTLLSAAASKLLATGVAFNIGGTASIKYMQSKIDRRSIAIGPDSEVRYICNLQS